MTSVSSPPSTNHPHHNRHHHQPDLVVGTMGVDMAAAAPTPTQPNKLGGGGGKPGVSVSHGIVGVLQHGSHHATITVEEGCERRN